MTNRQVFLLAVSVACSALTFLHVLAIQFRLDGIEKAIVMEARQGGNEVPSATADDSAGPKDIAQ